MVELICAQCGGTLSISKENVILDEACAQLVQTLICPYCGSRYAMGDELRLAPSVIIVQQIDIEAVEGEMVGVSIGGEDGSDVNIDQKMKVGVVSGRLVGAQISDLKRGDVRVEQNIDTLDGIMVGGLVGGMKALTNGPDTRKDQQATKQDEQPETGDHAG